MSDPQTDCGLGDRRRHSTIRAVARSAATESSRRERPFGYLGRKPSFAREQFKTVRDMLGHQAVGIAQLAKMPN